MCFNPSPERRVPSPNRYMTFARFCFCKNNKRTIIIRRLKFSELRDAELSTKDDRLVEPLVGPDGPRYEVERIVMHRNGAGQKEMFVHWKGYDASHGRWVSRASLAQDVPEDRS